MYCTITVELLSVLFQRDVLEVNGVPAPCGSLACVCALYGVSPSYALEVEFAAESLYCNTICVVYQKLHASGFNRQYL